MQRVHRMKGSNMQHATFTEKEALHYSDLLNSSNMITQPVPTPVVGEYAIIVNPDSSDFYFADRDLLMMVERHNRLNNIKRTGRV